MKRMYKKLLNKKDPIDRERLRLAKEKKLKVGVTELVRPLGKYLDN